MINEDQLIRWSQAPSETEGDKCRHTRDVIQQAIEAHFGNQVDIYYQGSYGNHTNVSLESDVDIIAEYKSAYYPGLYLLTPEQCQNYWTNYHNPHPYSQQEFREKVAELLQQAFGATFVDNTHEKCIKVVKNSIRVNADVIPCFTHKRFVRPDLYDENALGIQFFTKGGVEVINYPKQHIEKGETKNVATNGKYKDIVRTLKKIRHSMIDERLISNELIDSHLIECMVYHVPNSVINLGSSYRDIIKNVLISAYGIFSDQQACVQLTDVHELMFIFRGPYNPGQGINFMNSAWNFIGYNNGN